VDLVKETEAVEIGTAIKDIAVIMEDETMIVDLGSRILDAPTEIGMNIKTCNMALVKGMHDAVGMIAKGLVATLTLIGIRDMEDNKVDMVRVIKETGVVNKADTVANKVDMETREDMAIKVTVTRAIGVSKVDMVNKVNMVIREDMVIRDTVTKVIGVVSRVDMVDNKVDMETKADMVDQEDLNLVREHMEI